MPLGLLDLSSVTDTLINTLTLAMANSKIWAPNAIPPFSVGITGDPPDTLAGDGGCQLSVYLFHIAIDKFQRNSPITGPWSGPDNVSSRVPVIPYQPLCLDLYYLLTSTSDAPRSYVQEQQVMSMALKCFHENPYIRMGNDEFCLSMEVESVDELSRLWQAFTSPFRLSAAYKVSVVFIEAPDPQALGAPVEKFILTTEPTTLPLSNTVAQVIGTFAKVEYVAPKDPAPLTQAASYDLFPATAAVNQPFLLFGANFRTDPASHDQLFLKPTPTTEIDVTPWVDWTNSDKSKLALSIPTAGAPGPGVYELCVGSGAFRSNTAPLSIAALVNPAGGPYLPSAVTYTIAGQGFLPGATELLLDTVPLALTPGIPTPGQFAATATSISFKLPATLPSGRYAVRVRVNNVESAPALWVTKP